LENLKLAHFKDNKTSNTIAIMHSMNLQHYILNATYTNPT
jgi:hypothetical protein